MLVSLFIATNRFFTILFFQSADGHTPKDLNYNSTCCVWLLHLFY
nr:MAG TPA: hypothetical protein [Caudoviricetes sp.]